MAKNYEEILTLVNAGNQMGLSNTIKRDYGIPLDFTSVQESYDAAVIYAATSTLAYIGQTVAVGDKLYIISATSAGKYSVGEGTDAVEYENYLAEVGSKTEGDGNTIELNGQTLSLAGLTNLASNKTYVPSYVNGRLIWSEPDTSTAEGQAQEIAALQSRTALLEEVVNGTEDELGLVDLAAENADSISELEAEDESIREDFAAADTAILEKIGDIDDDQTVVELIEAVADQIPTNNIDLENGAGYQTASDVASAILNKADKATTLAGYGISDAYTKTEVDGKITEVNNTIASLTHMSTQVVDSVPEVEDAEAGVIYLVADENAAGTYIEYILVENESGENVIEQIGSTATDLSEYAKSADVVANTSFEAFKTANTAAIADAKQAGLDAADDLSDYKAEVEDALDLKLDSADFETFKGTNTSAIATAKAEAIAAAEAAEEAKGYAVAADVAETYAEKATTLAGYGITDAYSKNETVAKSEVYTKTELADLLSDVSDNVSDELDSIRSELSDYIQNIDTELYGADIVASWTSDDSYEPAYTTATSRLDKAIADIVTAQTTAEQGVADAADVASDLADLALEVEENADDIVAISGRLTTLETAKGNHETRLGTLEGKITSAETTIANNSSNIGSLQGSVQSLNAEDARLADLISSLSDSKADILDVYSKTEADQTIADAIGDIPAVDLTPYAKIADVETDLSKINASLSEKANADEVYTITAADAKFLTSAQVDARINTLIGAADDEDTITNVASLIEYVNDNAAELSTLISTVDDNVIAIQQNAADITTINGNIADLSDEIAAIIQPKASAEISVATDGELGIIGMSTDKLVQGTNTLVLSGGSAVDDSI